MKLEHYFKIKGTYELKNGVKMKDRIVEFWNTKEVNEEIFEVEKPKIKDTETKVKVVKTLRKYLET